MTEAEARAECAAKKRGGLYDLCVVWRYLERKIDRRWRVDLDAEETQPLDP